MEINHPVYEWIPFTASPDDSELLGRELYASAMAGELGVISPYVAPPVIVAIPQAVTRFKALAAMHNAGLLTSVQSIIDAPETDMLVKLAWDNAQTFERTSPTVLALAQTLSLTGEQLDALFTQASQIKA